MADNVLQVFIFHFPPFPPPSYFVEANPPTTNFRSIDPDPRTRHTLWSLGIGSGIFWVACYGVNQALVQRSLCTPSLRTAQVALWLNLPGLIALLIVCSLCGFVVYAQYRDCDPLTRPNHIKKDQLLPLYVIEHLDYPCIPGLFTASVFSGSLSSISSVLNALATVALQDMVRPYCLPKMKDSAAANVSKGIAVGFGALMILLTYVASHLGGVMQAVIGVVGMISGPMLGLFVLAMTNPWSNTKGAYGGYLTGLVATSWLGIGAFIYKPYVYKPPVSLSECPVGNITYVTPMYLNDSTTTAATSRPEDRCLTSFIVSEVNTVAWLRTAGVAFVFGGRAADRVCSAVTDSNTARGGILPVLHWVTDRIPDYRGRGDLGFYEISYLWYTLFGAIVVIVVGTIVSLLTGAADPNDVDPKLLTPVVKSFFCCLPAQFRRAIQRNINRTLDDGDVDPMSTSSTYKKCPTDEAFSTDTQI
ncbi:Sodium-coupled monocarboxylate transporter 1 [Lamellibrachia satsuma]|nr:Sodium-coupled monocarboxylate transporter 1 [Lamellibrachia satsuma]